MKGISGVVETAKGFQPEAKGTEGLDNQGTGTQLKHSLKSAPGPYSLLFCLTKLTRAVSN